MLIEIVSFEIRRRLRRISTYLYFFIFAALGFLIVTAASGVLPGAEVTFGGSGKVLLNSPFFLGEFINALSAFGLLITSAVMGQAVYQDFACNTHSTFFSTSVSRAQYLAGRYLAGAVIVVLILMGIGVGFYLATLMPWVPADRLGSSRLMHYVQPYLTGVIPTVLFTGALFFSMSTLTRRIAPVYAGGVILLIGYMIAVNLIEDLDNKTLASMIDPFGLMARDQITGYWTVAERNTRMVPFSGVYLANRLLWLAGGAGLLALTYARFRFVYALPGRKPRVNVTDTEPPDGSPKSSRIPVTRDLLSTPSTRATGLEVGALFRHAPGLVWLEFRETVKNVYFGVILLAGVLFMVTNAINLHSIYGTSVYPVTYAVLEITGGTFSLFAIIIITFYAGELIWRERDAGTDQIVDALPVPTWLPFTTKLAALILVQILLVTMIMMTGIGIQLFQGYTNLELGLYLTELFGLTLVNYCLLCILAVAIHVVVNHKYLGHTVMILFYLSNVFLRQFGLEHNLYTYTSSPDRTYSDMNGYGHFLNGWFTFNSYWAALAVLLLLLAGVFWVRGRETQPRWRMRLARKRASTSILATASLAALTFVGLGGYIFYNTNILNDYATRAQQRHDQAKYEMNYKIHEGESQPRIVGVKVEVDIFPEERRVSARGQQILKNKTSFDIQKIFVTVRQNDIDLKKLEIASGNENADTLPMRSEVTLSDPGLGFYSLELSRPLIPGETATLFFEIDITNPGFRNSGSNTDVVYNGTFFNESYFPHIGYQAKAELSEDNQRKKQGLEPKERYADVADLEARLNTYFSSDSDGIDFEATVSTSADQIAVAPGYLEKEWIDGERHYFQYKMDRSILNFYAFLSARYEVLRDEWRPVDGDDPVAIEIYYHRGHEYNLEAMVKSIKQSLDYFTNNFSPYQYRQVRILEFPRFQDIAQAFSNTVPYSESVGFIAKVDPDAEKNVDFPFYVTSHEVAHQWWGHQVVGGNVQGCTLLSETLSQYSALMVMKQEYGVDDMKRFLQYELDRYLTGRGAEQKKELPLARVENQPYIHYHKGSLVMYALQDYLGEDIVNRALSDYIDDTAYQEPPYTNSLELIERLRTVTPEHLQYIIEDLFETITLYENRAVEASYHKEDDGQYRVTLQTKSRKLKADGLGAESEVQLADWIDIGVLGIDGKPLYMEKHMIDQPEMEFSIVVDAEPRTAGIDPYNKLIDRQPKDNTKIVEKAEG